MVSLLFVKPQADPIEPVLELAHARQQVEDDAHARAGAQYGDDGMTPRHYLQTRRFGP